MRVATKAAAHAGNLLMHQAMAGNRVFEVLIAGFVRRISAQQNPRHFQEVALARQLIDRIAAVQQNALFGIDPRDGRLTACGVSKAGVETAYPRGSQRTNIHAEVAQGPRDRTQRN